MPANESNVCMYRVPISIMANACSFLLDFPPIGPIIGSIVDFARQSNSRAEPTWPGGWVFCMTTGLELCRCLVRKKKRAGIIQYQVHNYSTETRTGNRASTRIVGRRHERAFYAKGTSSLEREQQRQILRPVLHHLKLGRSARY